MSFTLSKVSYRYPSASRPALRNITLSVAAGQTTVFLGPSGSGKSTLLSLLGLLWEGALDQGAITYHNGTAHEYGRLSHEQRAQLRMAEFGFVLQSSYLLPHFTCGQNIGLPLAFRGVDLGACDERVTELIVRADPRGNLLEAKDRLPGDVAGGQKQRMAVLRAIVHNPRVVFADEPFSHLDPVNTERIVRLLLDWRSGLLQPGDSSPPRTLIVVCHDLEIARTIADECVLLDSDHTVVDGRPLTKDRWPDIAQKARAAFSGLFPSDK